VVYNIWKLIDARDRNKTGRIRVRFTENEKNRGQWDEFSSFFKRLGVDDVFRRKVHSFADLLAAEGTPVGQLVCNQPCGAVNFTMNGDLTTCCVNWRQDPVFGNIKGLDIKSLWESKDFENWRQQRLDSTCADCSGLGSIGQRVHQDLTEREQTMVALMKEHGDTWYWERHGGKQLHNNPEPTPNLLRQGTGRLKRTMRSVLRSVGFDIVRFKP
jgi:radical SAM protein with 4Fe4S-binding SPASM domain